MELQDVMKTAAKYLDAMDVDSVLGSMGLARRPSGTKAVLSSLGLLGAGAALGVGVGANRDNLLGYFGVPRRSSSPSAGMVLGILGAGVALGAVAALLLAPTSGRELRELAKVRLDAAIKEGSAAIASGETIEARVDSALKKGTGSTVDGVGGVHKHGSST